MSDVKIPNLQAVFGGNKITENKSVIEEKTQEIVDKDIDKFEKILNINIDNLIEFKEHIFNEISENKFEELVESISQNGVLDPIIVRKSIDDKYEIIAGHNRVRACKTLKMQTVPVTIKNVDDDTAKLIMIDTNINRRDKLLPSELMKAYSMKMEILKNLKGGQTVHNEANSTESNKTREKIAEKENISGRQIARYLRLKELIPDILRCVDKDLIPFLAGVELSYLKPKDQETIISILNDNPTLKISVKQCEILKNKKDKLTEDYILDVLNKKTAKQKPKFTGKVKQNIVKKYKDKFKNDDEFTELIEKLLESYFNSAEI
ncbi:MAG: ParB/RepB/Spo0J family partition protein [Clostridia bacterium]|nr:ParB/RepB/Spo0J family partition protein [Clostridia bacterium]